MPTAIQVKRQIEEIVCILVEESLADDLNEAILRTQREGIREISFGGGSTIAATLKNWPYDEIYKACLEERSYNVRMLDGALIQMSYRFDLNSLMQHRLAFFPSPSLESFQSDPEAYLNDEIYLDVVASNIVHFPIRFDYDASESAHRDVEHPKSHVTLGQYKNCRIPVVSPMTPFWFADFILRNFYHNSFATFSDKLPNFGGQFGTSISDAERQVIHIAIPT